MAEQSSQPPIPAATDEWKHTGVRVIPGDQLDSNTAQTPGFTPLLCQNACSDDF